MIRNVIFDWSGTLVDDLPAVWRATNFVLTQAGLPEMTLEQFRAEFCLPFTDFYKRYTPHVGLEQLEVWFHAHFKEAQHSVAELPHAREFLLFCREQGLRSFVLSTVHRDHFAVQAAATGFHEFLERPYIEVRDKRARIQEILKENRLAQKETLFIGDMQHDIETARHGGIWSCAVLTGYNSLAQLRAVEPDLIVEHLGELREILLRNRLELPGTAKGLTSERYPVVTVGALIFDDQGRVLMIRTHKWSDLWGIPGGKTKYGENSIQAVRREIREETALEVSDIEFVLAQDCIFSTEFYRQEHFVLLNYTCRSSGSSAVKLNEEAEEFKWAPISEAAAMALNQPTRNLLEAVISKQTPL